MSVWSTSSRLRFGATLGSCVWALGCDADSWDSWKVIRVEPQVLDCHTAAYGDCSYANLCETEAALATSTELADAIHDECEVRLRIRCADGCAQSASVEP